MKEEQFIHQKYSFILSAIILKLRPHSASIWRNKQQLFISKPSHFDIPSQGTNAGGHSLTQTAFGMIPDCSSLSRVLGLGRWMQAALPVLQLSSMEGPAGHHVGHSNHRQHYSLGLTVKEIEHPETRQYLHKHKLNKPVGMLHSQQQPLGGAS